MKDVMVHAEAVEKSFGAVQVLRGIDLEVKTGEVACIIGPSGSGKSTFLRCINHLESIDRGRLLIDGHYVGYEERNGKLYELSDSQLAAQRAEIGMVFQRFNLFSHLTVLQNIIEAPVLLRRMPRAEAIDVAMDLLNRVGLGARRDSYPAQLSGGQQQRVAIARALAMRPKLMLFDEPTSALDPELVGEVLAVMRDLASEGRTMIIVIMDEGRIIERGDPRELTANPRHARTQAFLSSVL
jgi:polar amino acid transport system ATP-binding protein